MVLPYEDVRHLENLRVSLLGVVPQRDRSRRRLIVDYTFSDVKNLETVPLAPKESMQFGRALHRVMTWVVHANPTPVYLSKINIADGFYRVWLQGGATYRSWEWPFQPRQVALH